MPNLKVLKGYVETFSNMETVDEKSGSNLVIDMQRNYKPTNSSNRYSVYGSRINCHLSFAKR